MLKQNVGVVQAHRTSSIHNSTELARCGEVCHMRSGWFDCTEPSLSTSLQGKQGVQGAYALVLGGSSTSNLLEPTRTTAIYSVAGVRVGSMRFDVLEPPRTSA